MNSTNTNTMTTPTSNTKPTQSPTGVELRRARRAWLTGDWNLASYAAMCNVPMSKADVEQVKRNARATYATKAEYGCVARFEDDIVHATINWVVAAIKRSSRLCDITPNELNIVRLATQGRTRSGVIPPHPPAPPHRNKTHPASPPPR